MARPRPRRRFGELSAVWARACGRNHRIKHLHSNSPSKQQINQPTNHTSNKKINQATTASAHKSMVYPFTRKPMIQLIPKFDDQIKVSPGATTSVKRVTRSSAGASRRKKQRKRAQRPLPSLGEQLLNFLRALPGVFAYRHPAEQITHQPQLLQPVRQRPCGIQKLQLDHRAGRDHTSGQMIRPRLPQLVLDNPEHAGGVDQVEGWSHLR
jgi:hypothetical protein